ncbi:MAG TPA: hypothetical protein VNV17_06410 [Solirubrobacteraceae bacterium]|nr:hypothetical protein [Solirubrobacteraceae bacterium]
MAPFLAVRDLEVLQLRMLTEAVWAIFERRLGLDCFLLGAGLTGVDVTGAGFDVTGALATGVGAGLGVTGTVAGGVGETGVVVGGVGAGGVLEGGVLVGGVGADVVVPEPLQRLWAQHGSTTRSLLTGMPGPPMIQRFSGE